MYVGMHSLDRHRCYFIFPLCVNLTVFLTSQVTTCVLNMLYILGKVIVFNLSLSARNCFCHTIENALQIDCTFTEATQISQNRLVSRCVWFTIIFVSNYCQYSHVVLIPQLFNSCRLNNDCSWSHDIYDRCSVWVASATWEITHKCAMSK